MLAAELLQRQPLGLDARAYVVVDSSDTLLRTLADAVDLAKAEAGELVLDPQPILIREIMDEVQQTWTPPRGPASPCWFPSTATRIWRRTSTPRACVRCSTT